MVGGPATTPETPNCSEVVRQARHCIAPSIQPKNGRRPKQSSAAEQTRGGQFPTLNTADGTATPSGLMESDEQATYSTVWRGHQVTLEALAQENLHARDSAADALKV